MTADTLTLGPGSIVGSYQLIEEIGSGGMGAVFEAVHLFLRRRVAIKVMHAALLKQPGMDTRMIQEASILEELQHVGVVRVFDCGRLSDSRPWIAMEMVVGESLATRLIRENQLGPAEVCSLLAALTDVLSTVHVGNIIHRDLKPDNVLFTNSGSGFPLRIIDWGVARLGPAARLTQPGITCGTPTYMSPEQVAGRNIAAPCDIYSLGVIAYEALAGHPPFEGVSLVEVVAMHLHGEAAPLAVECPTAPPALCNLIHQMLHKVPGARPTAVEARERICEISTLLADVNPEFESYDLSTKPWTPTTLTPSVIGTTTTTPTQSMHCMRWTPEMPLAIPASLGDSLIEPGSCGGQIVGEFRRKH